jgi:hypothetical protein
MKDDISSWMQSAHLSHDIQYLIDRFDNEGDAFICKTMCMLGKEIETSLVQGRKIIIPPGWSIRSGTSLPRHFYHYFSKVYEDDGSLRAPDEDNRVAARLLRQLFLFWSKRASNTLEGEAQAIEEFLSRVTLPRHRLYDGLSKASHIDKLSFSRAKAILSDVFGKTAPKSGPFHEFQKEPWGRHGPGAVAFREEAAEKWDFVDYPHLPHKLFMWSDKDSRPVKTDRNPSSRVTCVPKDFRGPRIICIEPKEFQFGQQGLMELLMEHSQRHSLMRKAVNFANVSRSHKMCFNTYYATIDMKEASDLVSLQLVKELFPRWLYRLLVRYRTPLVNNTRSTCFATMGSALCFPVQTFVFWALCLGTMEVHRGAHRRHVTGGDLQVFGDDIIVPKWIAPRVCSVLTACGLMVNPNKTCINSEVREACGEWVYAGVTARIAKPKIHRIRSYEEWLAAVDTAEILDGFGFFNTSAYYRSCAADRYRPITRYGERYQRMEVRVPSLVKRRAPQLEGYSALYAWNFHSNTSPFSRGARLRVKWRWIKLDSKFLI